MAYAGFRFIQAILTAKSGSPVIEEAFIYLPGVPGGTEIAAELGVNYFAVKVELSKTGGAAKALPIGTLSENEKKLLEVALKDLKGNIQTGAAFMSASS
jgi:malate dehydrogenase